MLALTLPFSPFWIPVLITVLLFFYFNYLSQEEGGWNYFSGFGAILGFGMFVILSLASWLIFFIVMYFLK